MANLAVSSLDFKMKDRGWDILGDYTALLYLLILLIYLFIYLAALGLSCSNVDSREHGLGSCGAGLVALQHVGS